MRLRRASALRRNVHHFDRVLHARYRGCATKHSESSGGERRKCGELRGLKEVSPVTGGKGANEGAGSVVKVCA